MDLLQRRLEEEEEEVDASTESATIMVILTLMVVFSIGFEQFRDTLEESTDRSLMPVLNSLFGELTLLGFIGLSLFLLDKLDLVHSLSLDLFNEEGTIGELCEQVHMALFLVMVIFLATVIMLTRYGGKITLLWIEWEEGVRDVKEMKKDLIEVMAKRSPRFLHLCDFTEPAAYQRIVYTSLRQTFISDMNLSQQFNFQEYMTTLLGGTLAEVVEIPIRTWFSLWCFMIVCYVLHENLSSKALLVVVMMLGYSLPLLMHVIHAKVKAIKFDSCNLKMLHQIHDDVEMSESSKLLGASATSTSGGSINSGSELHTAHSYDVKGLEQRYGKQSNLATDEHHLRFWKGAEHNTHAPSFTLALIRFSLLLNSIYVAVCLLMVFPGLADEVSSDNLDAGHALIIVILALIPPFRLLGDTPHTIKDFTIVSNIENMRNGRVVEQGIRRMKTRMAFMALKVIYLMLHGAKQLAADSNAGSRKKIPKSSAVSASETAVARRKAAWKLIFDIFDEDGEGSLTNDELAQMFKRVAGEGNITQAEVDGVINHIDEDHDGEISFEEFFAFVNQLSEFNDQNSEEISKAIFHMVDQKDEEEPEGAEEEEDEISIKELQDMCHKCGQPLSADDVFEVIQDIDEDGNGKLNEEEFFTLLQRLGVV